MLCYISIADMFNVAADIVDDFTKTYTNVTSNNTPLMCDIYINVKSTADGGASFMIMAMAIERFYATYYPFRYKEVVTAKRLTAVAFGCFAYNFVGACMLNITFGNESGKCFLPRSGVDMFVQALIFAESIFISNGMPAVSVVVFNILIVLRLRRRNTSQRLDNPSYNSLTSPGQCENKTTEPENVSFLINVFEKLRNVNLRNFKPVFHTSVFTLR